MQAMKRYNEAADAYGRAIALGAGAGPQDELWPLLLLQASALEDGNRWPEAKQALEQGLAIAPDQPLLLNFLGYAKLERGEDVDAAEAMIRKASELAPDDASITDSLGWAQFKRGKIADAIATLQKAAEKDPDQAEIQEHLGDALVSRRPALRGALCLERGAGHRRGRDRGAGKGQARRRADPGQRRALIAARARSRRPSSTSRCTSAASCPTGGTRSRRCSLSARTATG